MRRFWIAAAVVSAACGSGGKKEEPPAPAAATPVFSVAGGAYSSAQSVAITCATPGATIHYTVDGTSPTTASAAYASAVAITTTGTTLRAMATATGLAESAAASATYVLQAAAPTFSPPGDTYAAAQSVAVASATPGATIRCTRDGSAPTAASAACVAAVEVAASGTLQAIATAPGFTDSDIASASYVVDAGATPAAAPAFSPPPGTYASAQSVTLTTATAGAAIHYTTDGSAPTAASTLYTGAIAVAGTTTIRAIATGAGHAPSDVVAATYAIGTGTGFLALCEGRWQAMLSLVTTCLKANPSVVSATDCADQQREIDANRVSYDSARGATCLAAMQALTCADMQTGAWATVAACDQVVTGQVANGGDCYSGASCASGWCTSDSTSACPGTCQAYAGAGAQCSDATCAPGLDCDYAQAIPTCKPPSAAGGACPCHWGLWCDRSGGAPGVCRAQQTSGACDVYTSACAMGYACTYPRTAPTCQPLVGLGGSCANGERCGVGYTCAAGSCVSWPSVGDPCGIDDYGCIGGYCSAFPSDPTGTCLAYKADGDPCSLDTECASSSCSAAGRCERSACTVP